MGFTVLKSLLSLILFPLFRPCRPYDEQYNLKLGCFLGLCNEISLADLPQVSEAQQSFKC